MEEFQVGMGRITLRVRHARSLKDKRKIVQSLKQRLRNQGFSVAEVDAENLKIGSLGIAYAGNSAAVVEDRLQGVKHLLLGDFEVLDYSHELVDYAGPEEEFEETILDDRDPD